jgi:hypothetical protein
MTPRSEYFAALWSMSSMQNILVAGSVLVSLTVFVLALLRVCLMDAGRVAAVASLPLEMEQE